MASGRSDAEKVLGPLEAEVMSAMWAADAPMSVRDLLGELNKGRRAPLAYTTVMTVMSRLVEKAVLQRRREGRGYLYEARAKDAAAIAVDSVVRNFGDAAVAHFVEHARADPQLMRRLERLLEEDG